MNDILKQRLVGALVLIALAVVFWPVVFVESERGPLDRTSQVPPMPQLEDMAIQAPEPLADSEPVGRVDEMALHEAPPEAIDQGAVGSDRPGAAAGSDAAGTDGPPPSPSQDADGIPVAWVLQVASVSTREKADQLVAKLIDAEYKAYHRVIRKDGKELYRVYVGPVFERRTMVAAKSDIDSRFKVTSIIARYLP